MRIITGFEEEPFKDGPDERLALNKEFVKVFKALEYNLEVAENVFTRAAKRAFKVYTRGARFTETKDARDMRPTWVSEVSLVLSVSVFDETTYFARAADLQRLVILLGEGFSTTVELPNVSLIEPLKCTIKMISEIDRMFTVKQTWAPQ